jgi:hypothetical protein
MCKPYVFPYAVRLPLSYAKPSLNAQQFAQLRDTRLGALEITTSRLVSMIGLETVKPFAHQLSPQFSFEHGSPGMRADRFVLLSSTLNQMSNATKARCGQPSTAEFASARATSSITHFSAVPPTAARLAQGVGALQKIPRNRSAPGQMPQ